MSSRRLDPKSFMAGVARGHHLDEPAGLHPVSEAVRCLDREHSPPSHLHVPAGHKWVHYCPSCKQKAVIYSSDTIC